MEPFGKSLAPEKCGKVARKFATPKLRLNREDGGYASVVCYLSGQDHADGCRKRDTTRCDYFFRIRMGFAPVKAPGDEPRGYGVGKSGGGRSDKELQPVISAVSRLFAELAFG